MAAKPHQNSLFGPKPTISEGDSESLGVFASGNKNAEQMMHTKSMMSDVIYGCCVKPAPGKGLGLFAEEDIPAGEVVLVERPSLVHGLDTKFWCESRNADGQSASIDLVRDFMKLSERDQSDVMSLYNGHEGQFPSKYWGPGERPDGRTLVGKFLTNRFRISSKLTGIYFRCATINHSCDFNCTFAILNDDLPGVENRRLAIMAYRNIKAGDELTISYIPCDLSFEERQESLFFWRGFRCVCSKCAEEETRLYPGGYDGYDANFFKSKRVVLQQSRLAKTLQGKNMLTVVKAVSGKTPTIPKNGTILEEIPLVLITDEELRIISKDSDEPRQDYHPMVTRFLQLSSESRHKFLTLSNWRKESSVNDMANDSIPSPEKLMGIWVCNRFPLDDGMEGVFAIISNLNHSCSPNCRVLWNSERKTLDLIALQSLEGGDRITVCYDHDRVYRLPVKDRQKYLRKNYGFSCRCTRCIKWVVFDADANQNRSFGKLSDSKIHSGLPYKLSEFPKSGASSYRLAENKKALSEFEDKDDIIIDKDFEEKLLR